MRAALAGAVGVLALLSAGTVRGADSVVPTPPGLECPSVAGYELAVEQQTVDTGYSAGTHCAYVAREGGAEARIQVWWSRDGTLMVGTCGDGSSGAELASKTRIVAGAVYADDPAVFEVFRAAAEQLVHGAESLAAPCPDAASPAPDLSAGPTCALEGQVRDYQGKPVAKVRLRVVHGALGDSVVETATDREGRYRVEEVAEQVTVRLVLEEGGPLGRFRVHFRGRPAELETVPLRVEPGKPCRVDIVLDGRAAGYGLVNPGVADGRLWRDLGSIYQRLFKAAEFARSLGIELDYSLPLDVYTWCTDPALLCRSAQPPAFYVGTRTDGEAVAEPYIALEPSASALRRGRYDDTLYHEFGHHVMTDAFGDALPIEIGDENHGGYYANRASTDSWVEGFANFFAAMVAKHVDGRLFAEHFEANGFVKDLEWDWSAWNDVGRSEEWAVAGLLLDLEDGPGDYRAGRPRPDLYDRLRWGKAVRQGRLLVYGSLSGVHAPEVTVVVEVFDAAGERVLADSAFLVNDFFVLPVPSGAPVETVRVKVVEGRIGQAVDDDPFDSSPKAIWRALAGYAAGKAARGSTGYPYVSNVFGLFRALDRSLGKADADRDGRKALVELFRAHGFFADVNGNLKPDPGERTGLTSHPAHTENAVTYPERDPRYAAEPLREQLVTVDTRGVEARSVVFVDYPDGERGYHYLARADDQGRVILAVPPAESGATVTLVTLAGGYLPALTEIDAGSFWAGAAEHRGEPFLHLQVKLEPGELRLTTASSAAVPLALLVAGGALIALGGAAALLVRHRWSG